VTGRAYGSVPGTHCLHRHITAVVGVDRAIERHPAGNFNAGLCETVELGPIVEQHGPHAVQHPEHASGDAVIALIVIEAECGVGVEGIEAVVLQLICPHLVGETEPAAFPGQTENAAAARSSSSARASRSCSPQSQHREPNNRQSGRRNATAREQHWYSQASSTMTATGLP
jgi:hypothetical protein